MNKMIYGFACGVLAAGIWVGHAAYGQTPEGMTLVRDFEGGRLLQAGKLNVLVLSGTYNQMGRQYGGLLGGKIRELYADIIERPFIEQETLSVEQFKQFLADPHWQTLPGRQREIFKGIESTSGLKLEQLLVADLATTAVVYERKLTGSTPYSCSSLAAWGKNTPDGALYTAHNFDFPAFFRELAAKHLLLVVFKPSDGSPLVAGLGYVGAVTSFSDILTGNGLYVAYNSAFDSAGLTFFPERPDIQATVMNALFETDSIGAMESVLAGLRPRGSIIMTVADAKTAACFEVAHWDMRKRGAGDAEAVAAANQFMDPSWGLLVLPNASAWFSSGRYQNLLNLAKLNAGKLGADGMRELLDVPMFSNDGRLSKGVSALRPIRNDGVLTIYQVVAAPAKKRIWIRLPGGVTSDWLAVDVGQL